MLTVFIQFIDMDMTLVFRYIAEIDSQQNGQLFSTQPSKCRSEKSGAIFLCFLLRSTLIPYANIQTNAYFILWAAQHEYRINILLCHISMRNTKNVYIHYLCDKNAMGHFCFDWTRMYTKEERSFSFFFCFFWCMCVFVVVHIFVCTICENDTKKAYYIFIAWHIL